MLFNRLPIAACAAHLGRTSGVLVASGLIFLACSGSGNGASSDVAAIAADATDSTAPNDSNDLPDLTSTTNDAGAPDVPEVPAPSIRGNRYCELLVVTLNGAVVDADVWGTQGLNACPAEDWASIDIAAVTKDMGATTVKVNGPRYWVLDGITAEVPEGEPRLFGTLEMRKLATIKVAITELQETSYTERTVNRNSEFEFNEGAEVYELVATDGATYVMQSYAQIADPALTEAALPALASRLKLPSGWTFRTRTLAAPLVISTPGKATVLQDDLQNTYSRVPAGL